MEFYKLTEVQCERLKSLIAKRGISAAAVGRVLGQSRANISRILSGNQNCGWKIKEWTTIAGLLGMGMEELVNELEITPDNSGLASVSLVVEGYSNEQLRLSSMVLNTMYMKWEFIMDTSTITIPKLFLRKAKTTSECIIISVPDNGLSPRVMRDDFAIIDRSTTLTVDGEDYLISTPDAIYIRTARSPTAGRISFVSLDPSYTPITMPVDLDKRAEEYCAMHGRVVSIIRVI